MKLYDEFQKEPLLEDHYKPMLSGKDLQTIFKLKPGPKIREILIAMREAQIEGVVKDKNDASKFVEGYLTQ